MLQRPSNIATPLLTLALFKLIGENHPDNKQKTLNIWLLTTLAAIMVWALSNVLDKALRQNYIKDDFTLTWTFSFLRLPIIIGLFIFTHLQVGLQNIDPVLALKTTANGLLWILPVFLYLKALSKEDASSVVLVMNLIPVFTFIIAHYTIGETLLLPQFVGFLFIFIGGVLATLKKLKNKWQLSPAFFLILVASLVWATSDVIIKYLAPQFPTFTSGFTFFALGSFIASLIFLPFPKTYRHFKKADVTLNKRSISYVIINVILGITGVYLFSYALTIGKASLTAVMIGIQPLFIIAIGQILSRVLKDVPREEITKKSFLFKSLSFIFIIFGLVFLHGV